MPQQITTSQPVIFTHARFMGIKSFISGSGVSNGGPVWVGIASGQCGFPVQPSAISVLETAKDSADSMGNLWAVGNSGDGLFILF